MINDLINRQNSQPLRFIHGVSNIEIISNGFISNISVNGEDDRTTIDVQNNVSTITMSFLSDSRCEPGEQEGDWVVIPEDMLPLSRRLYNIPFGSSDPFGIVGSLREPIPFGLGQLEYPPSGSLDSPIREPLIGGVVPNSYESYTGFNFVAPPNNFELESKIKTLEKELEEQDKKIAILASYIKDLVGKEIKFDADPVDGLNIR